MPSELLSMGTTLDKVYIVFLIFLVIFVAVVGLLALSPKRRNKDKYIGTYDDKKLRRYVRMENKKKYAALMITMCLLMSTMALAKLDDLPEIFSNAWEDTALVVGSSASGNDDAARTVLKTYFASFVEPEVNETSDLTNLDGLTEEIMLGYQLNSEFDTELDDSDIETLKDSTFEFDDETISYREIIKVGNDMTVETSLTASEDDYKDEPYIEIERGALGYYFVFDENIDLSNVDNDEPLEINFLGKNLKIIEVDNDEIEVETGEKKFVGVDESVQVEDKTLTVSEIYEDNIIVNVDGTMAYLDEGETDDVNGLWIRVEDIYYSDTRDERTVKLIVSEEKIHKTYKDGDEYIGQDEDDPEWVWDLDNLLVDNLNGDTIAGQGPTLGIVNDFVKDDYKDDPIKNGEQYNFPNDFAAVEFTRVEVDEFTEINFESEDSLDLEDVGLGTSETGLVLTSQEDDGIVLNGNIKTDKVYLTDYINNSNGGINETLGIFYKDENTKDIEVAFRIDVSNGTTGEFGYLNFDDTRDNDLKLGYEAILIDDNLYFKLKVLQENNDLNTNNDVVSVWSFNDNFELDRLGDEKDKDEDWELVYGQVGDWFNIGEEEEDLLTEYGMIIRDPSSNGNNDRVSLEIPADLQKVKVTIGTGDKIINEAPTRTEPVLTTESGASGYNMLILVGGPCVNSLTAEYLGLPYPSCGVESSISENSGIIRYLEQAGKTILIVAGWEKADTLRAANKVVEGGLTGTSVTV